MKGEDIFPYQSFYWNEIWILDLYDPFLSHFLPNPTPLTTPKILEFLSLLALFLSFPILILSSSFSLSHSPSSLSLHFFPPFLSFHLRLFNLFNDLSPFHLLIITELLTHYSFLRTGPLCCVRTCVRVWNYVHDPWCLDKYDAYYFHTYLFLYVC